MSATPPDCLGPRPTGRPSRELPPNSWDTHFHALGPQARFPYASTRKYTPPDAALEQCLAFHDRLGIDRGLEVHANTHGFDNAVDLDAVANSGGRYLGVIRLNERVTRQGCEHLHEAGIRGVRFAFHPQHSAQYGGELDRASFEHVLGCIEGLGWFVELHFDGAALPGLQPWLEQEPATLVIDHFGRVDPSQGVRGAPFRALLDLARRDHVWVKLSGADRITKLGPPYADVTPLAHALLEVAPDRLVWGSDWPHTGVFDPARMPDDADLVDALFDFVPDEALRRRVLVTNPERLLGIEGAAPIIRRG